MLRIQELPQLDEPILVLAFEGWNDAGESATRATRYVSEAFQARAFAELDPDPFYDFTVRRPTVQIGEDGVRQISWPSLEFSHGRMEQGPPLVFGTGAEPHHLWLRFSGMMAELVENLGVKKVVLLGSYLADVVYSRPVGITGFASSPELLTTLGVSPSHYEGPTGIVGVLADRFRRAGVEVLSFWAALPHYINASPNPRGTLALVEILSEALALKLDLAPLRQTAADFETRISTLVASDPELTDYVKQLKRREFAQ